MDHSEFYIDEKMILDSIEAHRKRNLDLQKQLTAHAIDLGQIRFIECHFWTPDKVTADQLAADLQPRGFSILASNQAVQAVGKHLWNLELVLDGPIKKALNEAFTEGLVRAAARRNSIYDGWGTSI